MLPLYQTNDQTLQLWQTKWAAELNPLLGNPIVQGNIVESDLILGVTVVNHKLGRKPVGWIIVDQDGGASVYRSAPFNDLTLALTSNAAVTVRILVF